MEEEKGEPCNYFGTFKEKVIIQGNEKYLIDTTILYILNEINFEGECLQ